MGGLRSVLSGLLLVAATVLTVLAIGSVWAQRQLLDTTVWTAHAVEIVHDPDVERVTADFLADQVVAQQDAALEARDLLPAQLQALADAGPATAHRVIEQTALETIRAGALDASWETTMRATHRQFVRWLDGSASAGRDGSQRSERSSDRAAVSFDLEPLVVQTARAAGVPDVVIEIGAAQVDAQVPLIDAGQYEQARADAQWLRARAALVAPLAILAAVGSVLLARRRKWAVVRVGFGAALAGLAVVLAAPRLGAHFTEAMTGDGAAPAVARAIWASAGPPLTQLGWIVAAAGVGLALLAAVFWPAPRGRVSDRSSVARSA